jgi:hypothetical protein
MAERATKNAMKKTDILIHKKFRHIDAGYEEAIEFAKKNAVETEIWKIGVLFIIEILLMKIL